MRRAPSLARRQASQPALHLLSGSTSWFKFGSYNSALPETAARAQHAARYRPTRIAHARLVSALPTASPEIKSKIKDKARMVW